MKHIFPCGTPIIKRHIWEENACLCSLCGKLIKEGHQWVGCKCSRCGKSRDEAHIFDDSRFCCKQCGAAMHEQIVTCEKCGGSGHGRPCDIADVSGSCSYDTHDGWSGYENCWHCGGSGHILTCRIEPRE